MAERGAQERERPSLRHKRHVGIAIGRWDRALRWRRQQQQ